jgi:hypothetical protein
MNKKIWIYIIEKELSNEQLQQLLEDCKNFVSQWKSHDEPVKAEVEIFKKRLLIFKNDEDFNRIGGCATDNLFRFVQSLERKYNTSLLNRQLVVFENIKDVLEVVPLSEVDNLIQQKIINENTIIYNTSIIHSSELNQFAQKFSESWLQNILQ